MLQFDNRLLKALPGDPETATQPRMVKGAVWSRVRPTPVAAPSLVAYSKDMATTLGISESDIANPLLIASLAGNVVLPGSEPYATVYGGHQFGHWAGQLGDGRAIYLGEVVNASGLRHELQLKGAGPTPYSRRADGRAVLRSSIREFLMSEAMHHLGVPTTRALSLVLTGDQVERDMFYDGNPELEPGAIVCRVAPSFTRFGHFEIHAARNDVALLNQLIDFTIARDFVGNTYPQDRLERIGAWFTDIAERTARMIAHWMRVGFVHGVMNTDNMSVLGLTIDYGPYGWMDNFDPGWTPNTTDAVGKRYAYGRQPEVARWNLERLGNALIMVTPEDSAEMNALADSLNAGLSRYEDVFAEQSRADYAAKFGFAAWREEDAPLVNAAFTLMRDAEIDMTLFFRALAGPVLTPEAFAGVFYREDLRAAHEATLSGWLPRYNARIGEDGRPNAVRAAAMNAVNPCYVLRNYLAQQAIDAATGGDYRELHALMDVLQQPYIEQPGMARFSQKRPDWARQKAGCSMLSCSS
jgi:uncharacterized protein YdiU (UPF0061 family)